MRHLTFTLISSVFLMANSAIAEEQNLKEDNQHIRKWTSFADNALALHKKIINNHPHTIKKSLGGYAGNKDYYIQEEYYSKKTGKLLSLVQWEKANPDVMHSVEVYVQDEDGRIIRDYTAAYLPGYHNAPVQTLVSFHQYSGKLHGFRSFDATGDRILERCQGEYKGKSFEFLMDEDDLYAASLNGNPIEEKVYAKCVGSLPMTLGKYKDPQ